MAEENKKWEGKKDKTCHVCGKSYEYALSTSHVDGKETCVHDAPRPNLLQKKRKENIERTMESHKMAGAMQRSTPQEKMVAVKRPPGRKSRYGREVEHVPESVIKGLEEKAVPAEKRDTKPE